jgi:succinate dehydrogenase / fumarate reductase cytochrome b subunit
VNALKLLVSSSVGKKLFAAITGMGALLFLITHLGGNLLILFGKSAFNDYAHLLHSFPFLFLIEIGLGATFILHIVFTVMVTLENRRARPLAYDTFKAGGGRTLASSTMIYSGAVILPFILFHIWGMIFSPAASTEGSIYDVVHAVLKPIGSLLFYLIGIVSLGLHLSHGISSSFQSMGLNNKSYGPLLKCLGFGCAWFLAGGFAIIAIVVFLQSTGVL